MRVSLESMVDEIQGSNTSKCSYFEAFCKQAMKCVCVCVCVCVCGCVWVIYMYVCSEFPQRTRAP